MLLIFLLIGFVLPGAVHWSFIPAHALFGIDQAAHEPERLTGPMSAACILIFAMPLFFLTPDRAGTRTNWIDASVRGFKSVINTTPQPEALQKRRDLSVCAPVLHDGMTALLTFGGVYAAGVFHWHALAMTAYGITLSIFAVFGGFFGGWLDDHFGSKTALFVSVGGTAILGLLSVTMGPDRILWFIPYDVHAPHVNGLPFFNTWPELIFLGILVLVAITVTAS